ncbi:exodeoxyribonuclease VII small subunit [Brachybacterium sp. EF45031]|uniref:exodeoxyribonuclease VII small subunit n=1 Tax=Brachybacterium sillae TaxID=2810536 RepID=UPI00217D5D3E|nr:exodeoxyribonuclease VII small subunit [Brachybacterium sillae]MCS6711171.1 exodeoxyribonuclease VII small subunit [Brachybacterium sillae]
MTPRSTTPDADATDTDDLEAASAPTDLPQDIAQLSYEDARDQLIDVVRRLESGQSGLEESIALWERGEMLATRCQQWLDGARSRLDEVVARRGQDDA